MSARTLVRKIRDKAFRPLQELLDEQNRMIFAQRDVVMKLNKQKSNVIRVIFVCHRPALWGSLQSIYEACLRCNKIEPIIFAIPNKLDIPSLGLNHENYIDEGAYDFFIEQGYGNVIQGYNSENGQWIQLSKLAPHYVFLQTPYDACRPKHLSSKVISAYAKVCFSHYAVPFMNGEIERESSPLGFIENVSMLFASNEEQADLFEDILKKKNSIITNSVYVSGAPKFDIDKEAIKESDSEWLFKDEKKIRVFWTPRWCITENNCTFFEFKDRIVEFFKTHDEFELIFRPHPQAFREYLKQGIMSEEEIVLYQKMYKDASNMTIDVYPEYITNFYTSDVLL